MNIDEILEEMDELRDKSGSFPLMPHKKFVDGERLRELINDIRLNLPHELKEAKKIEFDCQRILNEAKINAEGTIRKAEERATILVSKETVIAEANKKAMEIISAAKDQAAAVQKAAALSVAQMLNDAEACHQKSLLDIKRTKEKIQHTLKTSPSLKETPQNTAAKMLKDNKIK